MLCRWRPQVWVVVCGLSLGLLSPSISAPWAMAQETLELNGPEQPPVPLPSDVDAPSDLPEGAEVLVTGPLHEAFAEQFSDQPEPGIVIAKKPPEPINEVPPEYRPDGDDIVWIPGYWGWDPEREDFLWITGIWRQAPPDRNWVPGYWAEVPEGFQWIAGFWSLNTTNEIRYLPPPPEPLAADPSTPAPSTDHFWIPGQWTYVQNDYQWRAGYWTMGYPDWVWVPDRYVWTPLGCIFRPGYWDYVVAERGTVFCPVYYSQPVMVNYRLRPSYVVTTGPTLLANLFVYPRYHHYFFGNYYSSRYLGQTMYPWVTYYQQNRRYDPLYGYYRTHYRDGDYLNRINRLHNYYAANVNYQPPRTLTAQRDHRHDMHDRQDLLFQAMQLNKMVNVTNNVNHHMQLVRLGDNERQQFERGLDPARQLRAQRAEIEARARMLTGNNDGNRDRTDNNRFDSPNHRWNLPQLQDGVRLGSVAIGNPRRDNDRDRDNGRDRDNDPNSRNNSRDGQVNNDRDRNRDQPRSGDTNRDGIVDGRDTRDRGNNDTPNRDPLNPNGRDGNNRDTMNRDALSRDRDAVNRDILSRDGNNQNPLNRDRTGRDANDRNPLNRDQLGRDANDRNPLNRDQLGRDARNPLNGDQLGRDANNGDPNVRNPNVPNPTNPNPTTPNLNDRGNNRDNNGRDPNTRNPNNRDANSRDPLGRNPLPNVGDPNNRGPLGRDSNNNNGNNTNRDSRPRNDNLPGGANRNPIDSRILPGVVPNGSTTPNPGGQTGQSGKGLPNIVPNGRGNDRANDRSNDRRRDNDGLGSPGRSPGLPGITPNVNPGASAPRGNDRPNDRSNPGLNLPGANDRDRTPRGNSSLPGIAPGEPNPSSPRRGGIGGGGGGAPADIQGDLNKMREMSQRQIQRRNESAGSGARRAPQIPNIGKPEPPKNEGKGKGKDK